MIVMVDSEWQWDGERGAFMDSESNPGLECAASNTTHATTTTIPESIIITVIIIIIIIIVVIIISSFSSFRPIIVPCSFMI